MGRCFGGTLQLTRCAGWVFAECLAQSLNLQPGAETRGAGFALMPLVGPRRGPTDSSHRWKWRMTNGLVTGNVPGALAAKRSCGRQPVGKAVRLKARRGIFGNGRGSGTLGWNANTACLADKYRMISDRCVWKLRLVEHPEARLQARIWTWALRGRQQSHRSALPVGHFPLPSTPNSWCPLLNPPADSRLARSELPGTEGGSGEAPDSHTIQVRLHFELACL